MASQAQTNKSGSVRDPDGSRVSSKSHTSNSNNSKRGSIQTVPNENKSQAIAASNKSKTGSVLPVELNPGDDSVSQIMSNRTGTGTNVSKSSSVRNIKLKAFARKLEISKQAAALERKHKMENEQAEKRKQREKEAEKIKQEAEKIKQVAEEEERKYQQEKERLALEADAEQQQAVLQFLENYEEVEKEPDQVSHTSKMNRVQDWLVLDETDDKSYKKDKENEKQFKTDVKRSLNDEQPPRANGTGTESKKYPDNKENINAMELSLEMLKQQQNTLMSLRMPTQTLDKFNGDPLQFQMFMRTFHNIIEKTEFDPERKLNYLLNHTQGDPHQLIEGCIYERADHGYDRALDLLEQHYGQPYQISQCYIELLTEGPKLSPANLDGLKKLSLNLISCSNTLYALGELRKFENSDSLIKIVKRLPSHLANAWRKRADVIMYEMRRPVTLSDLSDFVEKSVREAKNPLFGVQKIPAFNERFSDSKPDRGKSMRQKSFATSTQNSGPKVTVGQSVSQTSNFHCLLKCYNSKPHYVNQCDIFRAMSYDDRAKFVKENNLCFACLSSDHFISNCKREKPCKYCPKFHTTLLHPPNPYPNTNSNRKFANNNQRPYANSERETASEAQDAQINCCSSGTCDSSVFLPIIPVRVKTSKNANCIETYALLDSGSDSSYCSDELLKQLNVSGKTVNIKRSTLSNANETLTSQIIDNVIVSDYYENNFITIPHLFSQKQIPISSSSIPTSRDLENYKYLQNINLPEINIKSVDLIIGSNVDVALEPIEVIPKQDGGPFATKTRLGWSLNGSRKNSGFYPKKKVAYFATVKPPDMCSTCFDSINDQKYGKLEPSIEQKRFLENASKTIRLNKTGHYEVDLPLKHENIDLPKNLAQAKQRLFYLKNRFKRDTKYYEEYKKSIKVMLDDGYAAKVTNEELNDETWYISHFGVYHPRKPNKLRVVFDCSARFKGTSLNDNLLPGPDLTNTLVGVLVKFRQNLIAVQGDIRAMFHQIQLPEKDTKYFWFLWWPNGDYNSNFEIYKMKVYLFGTIASPGVANFALKQTALDFGSDFSDEAVKSVQNNFYVDDILCSADDSESAVKLIYDIKEMLKRGGFSLGKFMSNDENVLKSLPSEDCAGSVSLDLNKSEIPTQAALGVKWNINGDSLGFSVNVPVKSETRRGILSVLNSVFDPLGCLIPFNLNAKLVLKKLCQLKLGWDEDKCPPEILQQWHNWLADLKLIENYTIQRCYKPINFGKLKSAQLIHFADASNVAMASVSYIKIINENDIVTTNFVFAKSRLAPQKCMSIPRLELSAATLAANADKMLRNELQFPLLPSVFYIDSMTVLFYIRNTTKSFHTFVSNRIDKIRNITESNQWRFVSTKNNIADIATRGLSGKKFVNNKTWKFGPEFIQNENCDFEEPTISHTDMENDCEIKKEKKSAFATEIQNNDVLQCLMNKYSDWMKLRKIVAWVLRYKQNLLNKVKKKNSELKALTGANKEINPIQVEELHKAENAIFLYLQQQEYAEEIDALQKGKQIKQSSKIIKLQPILVDNILRVGGRLIKSKLSFQAKHQIIVSKTMPIVAMLVRWFHQLNGHSGRQHVISKIREKYWLINANSCTRKVLKDCVACRKVNRNLEKQIMSELPPDRLDINSPPFSNVGVDYFGPIMVKRGRSEIKRYGVLFTCLTLRAVHLELSSDLSTDAFILALRRFMARRGQPKLIRSDNGTNFVGAVRELKDSIDIWNQNQINNFLLQRDIKWIFNPPSASHFGGAWERLIRSVRKHLIFLANEQILTDESLHTFLCEAETIINSRPLTIVSSDVNDLNPLTPNDLLLNKSNSSLPPGLFNSSDNFSRKKWKQTQYLSDQFWHRFKKEYLPLLQIRQKWNKLNKNLKINDIVLICENNLPRNQWSLGRVIESFPDEKGIVRKVKLKTKDSTLLRPVAKLCLLTSDEN